MVSYNQTPHSIPVSRRGSIAWGLTNLLSWGNMGGVGCYTKVLTLGANPTIPTHGGVFMNKQIAMLLWCIFVPSLKMGVRFHISNYTTFQECLRDFKREFLFATWSQDGRYWLIPFSIKNIVKLNRFAKTHFLKIERCIDIDKNMLREVLSFLLAILFKNYWR